MGDYQDRDVGVLRMRSMPNFWMHASCDHAVAARLLPDGPRRRSARLLAGQRERARGQDYDLDKMLPFWQLTSEQDWDICEVAAEGRRIDRLRAGPVVERKEYNVDAFIRWYLRQMRTGPRRHR